MRESDRGNPPHNINLALYALFVLFTASLLCATLVEINSVVHAVKAEQSEQYAFLEHSYPVTRAAARVTAILSAALVVLAAALSVRSAAPAAVKWPSAGLYALYAASICLAFARDIRYVIPAGVLLFITYIFQEAGGGGGAETAAHFREFYRSVRGVTVVGLVRFAVKVILVFTLAGPLIIIPEALIHTMPYAGKLFSAADFSCYVIFAAAGGALICAAESYLGVVPAALVFLVSRLRRFENSNVFCYFFALIAPIWFAFAIGSTFADIVGTTFRAEIADLDLEAAEAALSFLVGYLLLMTTYINFKFIIGKLAPMGGETDRAVFYAVAYVISMLMIPFFPLLLLYLSAVKVYGYFRARRPPREQGKYIWRWAFCAGGLAGAGVLLYVLGSFNYPRLMEYSYSVQSLYSIGMIGAVVCGLFMVVYFAGLRGSPRLWWGGGIVALVALASLYAWVRLDGRQQLRLIMIEYAALGRTVHGMLTTERTTGLGMDGEPSGVFKPYGERHAVLPADPGVKDFSDAPPPIIFIIMDAVRPDRVRLYDRIPEDWPDVYGYSRATTPSLRKFADDAVIFTNARSESSGTIPAMKNIFSGRYATRCLNDDKTPGPFFTDDLLGLGYQRFFIKHFEDDRFTLGIQNFLRFIPEEEKSRFVTIDPYDEKDQVAEALRKIGDYEKEIKGLPPGKQGYFVYLHFVSAHFPWRHYDNEPGIEHYGYYMSDMYDEDVAYADKYVGVFLEGLKKLGAYDKSVIIITADHGTALGDHASYAEFFPYEEQIRVPLLIKVPGVERRVVDTPFSGVDLAPTIMNLFQRGAPNRFDGISFLPLMTGKENSVDRDYIVNICFLHDAFTLIQDNRWKLIYNRDHAYYMLYDLKEDPRETRSVADQYPERCAEMIKALERFLWKGRDTYANPKHYE